jgi:hypothetical protein
MSRIDGCIIARDVGIGVLSIIREKVGVYKYTGAIILDWWCGDKKRTDIGLRCERVLLCGGKVGD